MPPSLIGLALLLGLVLLVPVRVLQRAGWSGRALSTYFILVWALAMLAVHPPGLARPLLPIVVVAYVAPIVVAGRSLRDRPLAGLNERLRGPSREIKNVTPREPRDPDDRR